MVFGGVYLFSAALLAEYRKRESWKRKGKG
jgi:hypothetical protein